MRPDMISAGHCLVGASATASAGVSAAGIQGERPRAELHLNGLINAAGLSALIWAALYRLLVA